MGLLLSQCRLLVCRLLRASSIRKSGMHLRRMMALLFLVTLKVASRKTWKQTTTSKYSTQSQNPRAQSLCRGGQVYGIVEPPGTDPHAGWCGRGAAYKGCPLYRLLSAHSGKSKYSTTRQRITSPTLSVSFLRASSRPLVVGNIISARRGPPSPSALALPPLLLPILPWPGDGRTAPIALFLPSCSEHSPGRLCTHPRC